MSSSSVELTKVGSKVEDILTSLAKMLEEDKQKEKELTVSLVFKEIGCLYLDEMSFHVNLILLNYGKHGGQVPGVEELPDKWMGVLIIPVRG